MSEVIATESTIALDQIIQSLFFNIQESINIGECSAEQLKHYILEHSVFSHRNPDLLSTAANHASAVPALSAELERNAQEEMGSPGDAGHFALYRQGLREAAHLEIEGYTPTEATVKFLDEIRSLATSVSPSVICGAFYATEAGALLELEFVRNLTQHYVQDHLESQPTATLNHFFDLHLNGVEQEHKDGLGHFIEHAEQYGLDRGQIEEGFNQAVDTMDQWWARLSTQPKRT